MAAKQLVQYSGQNIQWRQSESQWPDVSFKSSDLSLDGVYERLDRDIIKDVSDLKQQLSARQREVNSLRVDFDKGQYQLQSLQSVFLKLHNMAQIWHDERDSLRQELEDVTRRGNDVRDELNMSRKTVGDLENRLKESNETIETLSKSFNSEYNKNQKTITKLKEDLASAQGDVQRGSKKMEHERSSHEKTINQLRRDLDVVNKELDSAKKTVYRTTEEKQLEKQGHEETAGKLKEELKKVTQKSDAENLRHEDTLRTLKESLTLSQRLRADLEVMQQQNLLLQEEKGKIEASRAMLGWGIELLLGAWFIHQDGGFLLLSTCRLIYQRQRQAVAAEDRGAQVVIN